MVYCPKCGTQNEDAAQYCVKCGANLQTGTYASRTYERKRMEQECFGLPHGGAIFGLVIGIIILIWGITTLARDVWKIEVSGNLWFVVLIIFGVLMIAGAIYGMTKRKQKQ